MRRASSIVRTAWRAVLLDDGATRRLALLTGSVAVIIGILAMTGIISALVASGHGASSDKIAIIGDVITGATLLLAAVAGLVAVLAYAVSTGAPKLKLRVEWESRGWNRPMIKLAAEEDLATPQTGVLAIWLINTSSYSARNPVVIIEMNGLSFSDAQPSGTWETTDCNKFDGGRGLQVQWDGGVDYSVHGHSTRKLPELELRQLKIRTWDPTQPKPPGRGVRRKLNPPSWEFEILAEGYRRAISVPIAVRRSGKTIFRGVATLGDLSR